MFHSKLSFRFALLALGVLVSPSSAMAQYHVTDLPLMPGATSSRANGINDQGYVVGDTPTVSRFTTIRKAWLWSPVTPNATTGSLTVLEPLGGGNHVSGAVDINNAGLIVGYCHPGGGAQTGTFWASPFYVPTDFNTLPRDPATAEWFFVVGACTTDPDADGNFTVVGVGTSPNHAGNKGIAWRMGPTAEGGLQILSVTVLDLPKTLPNDLNNAGQAVGSSIPPTGGLEAVTWDTSTGAATTATLGGTVSLAWGINSAGTIVGESNDMQGRRRPFIWTGGTISDLGTLGGSSGEAQGINDAGVIVGQSHLKGDRKFNACLWANGAAPQNLNDLKSSGATGHVLTQAYRINSAGQITAEYDIRTGLKAVLLTPQ